MTRYITLSELRKVLGGRSRSAIYLDLQHDRLPKPMKLGGTNYWLEAEVYAAMKRLRNGELQTTQSEADTEARADA